jgi:hypothetical protein
MRLVYWEYKGVKVPMVEDAQEGKLYCTGRVICKGLGLKEQDLKDICHRYPEHFQESLKVANNNLREFFKDNKKEFGMQRIRKIYSQQARLELVEKFIENMASEDGRRLSQHKKVRHLVVARE